MQLAETAEQSSSRANRKRSNSRACQMQESSPVRLMIQAASDSSLNPSGHVQVMTPLQL